MRKDIGEIVKIFYEETHTRNVGIPTNGTCRQRTVRFVQDMMERCPELDLGIDVSLDGPPEVHDDIRGVPGLFEQAVGTYRELRKLEEEYDRFNVNVETTVSSYNEDHLPEFYRYVTEELGVSTLFTLLTRGNPKEPSSKFFDVSKYEEYADMLEKGLKERTLSGYYSFPFADVINAKRIVRHRLIAKIVRENEFQIPCFAVSLGAALFANGDVLPCELLTDKVIGNIRDVDYDFNELWFSERADEAREWIRESKCFCTYECFHTLNITFNPRMYPQLLKEYLTIKWKKLFG
jgi:MoaA/NifB/PqqE/SkfB family radical SAM enzyme